MTWMIVAFLTFILSEAIGYGIHWAAHKSWSGPLFRAHLVHHTMYAPRVFEHDVYESRFRSSFAIWLAPVFVVLLCLGFAVLPWHLAVVSFLTLACNAVVTDIIHQAFHVKNHWLRGVPVVRRSLLLHMLHHRHTQNNLGITFYLWDRVFGTLRLPTRPASER